LFIPLLPLGQTQQNHRIDEAAFEAKGWDLHNTKYDQSKWDTFALYLSTHGSNYAYKNKKPADLTWVLVMRLLRNIVAHENDVHWTGITACLQQVLVYMKKRENFRELIRAEEESIKL